MILFFGNQAAVGGKVSLTTTVTITTQGSGGLAPPSSPNKAAVARYTLEVAWSAQAEGVFTIGVSTIGGTDGFGVSIFDTSFTGPNDDLSALLRKADVRRGKESAVEFVVRGEAVMTLRDKNGLLNRENASSPIADLIEGRYQPGRLRGYLPDGTVLPLFYGFLEKIEWTPDIRTPGAGYATLAFKDLLLWLDEARPIIASTGLTTTGAAIGKVLDAIGWTEPSARSLGVGDVIPDFSADGQKTALELIAELLQTERGIFYVNGAGVAVYQDRLTRQVKSSIATIADEMKAAVPSVDHSRLRNRVRVRRTQNNYVATAIDESLQTLIGARDLEEIDTPYLTSDTSADNLAGYILRNLAGAVSPLRDLKIDNRTLELLTQCLSRELGDVVTLSAAGADIVLSDYLIERLEHRVDLPRHRHETTWLLSQHEEISPFLVGSSQLVASDISPGDVLVY